jgi:Tol biopolymer transport system component
MPDRPAQRLPLLRALLAIGAVAASACVDAPATAPRFVRSEVGSAAKQSTSSSKIILLRDDPNAIHEYKVFTMNDDGTQLVPITSFQSQDALWAPDGKRILFASLVDVGSINSDGTGVTFYHLESLCPTAAGVLGKDIMVVSSCPTSYGTLYRVRGDGTGFTPLATGVSFEQPSPDPQTRTIAVSRDGDIVLVYVESGAITNITNTPNSGEDEPAFSPNGKQIAFRRCGGTCDIWVMNADGTNATLVARDGLFPKWSPDGKRIAFSRKDAVNVTWDIYTVGADGTGVTNLTKTTNITELVTAWASY